MLYPDKDAVMRERNDQYLMVIVFLHCRLLSYCPYLCFYSSCVQSYSGPKFSVSDDIKDADIVHIHTGIYAMLYVPQT